jgi:hypothetical protein
MSPIPDDFSVTKQHADYARIHGLPDPHDCVLQFVAHHQAKGTLSADWDAEFRKWLANERVYRKTTRGQCHEAHQPTPVSRAKRIADKLDEIARDDIQRNGYVDAI